MLTPCGCYLEADWEDEETQIALCDCDPQEPVSLTQGSTPWAGGCWEGSF